MAWQPDHDSLVQLAVCLRNSLEPDANMQRNAQEMLIRAKSSPDVNNYLAYLFSSRSPPQGLDMNYSSYNIVRSAAAVMLKNNVRENLKQIPTSSLSIIKQSVSVGLQDEQAPMRNYASLIATELISKGGLSIWPELLPELLKMSVNESGQIPPHGQEGAMAALSTICEDNCRLMEHNNTNGQAPIAVVLPRLIHASESPLPRVRSRALAAINVFLPRKSPTVMACLDTLLQRLFVLSNDQNREVQREICKIFVNLVEVNPGSLVPHLDGLVDYIIREQQSDDEELACEAAEFWLAVGEHDSLWRGLNAQHINKIIPVLLECIVYSPEDIAMLEGDEDDEDEEDRAEDLKPRFAKSRSAFGRLGADETSKCALEKLAAMESNNSQDEPEDGEASDDGKSLDDALDDGANWNLRKCSAASLDVFAVDFGGPVFQCVLPYLDKNLKHAEWPRRESAVLILGAISLGCLEHVTKYLPTLIPYLLTLMDDSEAVVRTITCWTLGRYAPWVTSLTTDQDKSMFFEPLLNGLINKMLDKSKKVQASATSAVSNFTDVAGAKIEPYIAPIVHQIARCFGKYQKRNMPILYDCIQALADHVGPALARPDISSVLMPVLIERWKQTPNDSQELFAIHECLGFIATAMGRSFGYYAGPIFARCVGIIHHNLEQNIASQHDPSLEVPRQDFVITSLDLCDSIIRAIEPAEAQQLVRSHQPSFFELLSLTLEDLSYQVRQSAYGLLGDCAQSVFPELQPALNHILPMILKQLDIDSLVDDDIDNVFGVVNNALWSAGEIAVKHGANMASYVPELKQRCIELMANPNVVKSIPENAAVTLGRLAIDSPNLLSQDVGSFIELWLVAMDEARLVTEKADAFRGICTLIIQNPTAVEASLLHVFTSIARFGEDKLKPSEAEVLRGTFKKVSQRVIVLSLLWDYSLTWTHMQLFDVYRGLIAQFDSFLRQMDDSDLQALRTSGYI